MTKICLVGAGSTVFAQNILGDVLSSGLPGEITISLFDIDPERLKTSEIVTRRICEALGLADIRVESTLDRRQALKGSDFVILMMQVGGYEPATVTDFDVPKQFGLRQTIADTLGIGGIFRGLRTIPVLEAICRDMEDVCPNALLMQYVNPMAINCWAIKEIAPEIRTVGLCHSVQHTAGQLA
ncbi:MAG: alpha-glucosidase/alpha-galactosidase, partial [Martelella sp.]